MKNTTMKGLTAEQMNERMQFAQQSGCYVRCDAVDQLSVIGTQDAFNSFWKRCNEADAAGQVDLEPTEHVEPIEVDPID